MRLNFYLTLILLSSLFSANAQTLDDFRSVAAGGVWTTAATWERYDGVTWQPAATTPTSANGVITITANSTVTVPANLTVDQVVVDGNLTINSPAAVVLTVANGTGTDLAISSTGTVLTQGALTPATSATFTCAAGGNYIHNTTSSAANVMTGFGTTGLAAASNFIYRGSSALAVPYTLGNRTYGNLIFESTSGLWVTTNAAATTPTTVLGTLRVGATNAGTVQHIETAQTGALTITGGIEIGAGSRFDSRAGTANAVTVNGPTTIGTNGILNIQAQSFINNSTITGSSGILRFGSAASLTTLSGSGSVNIGQIRISTINNVTLSQPATTTYFIFFNTGNLIGSGNLTLGIGAGNTFVQFGQAAGTTATGSFDASPSFNAPFLGVYYLEQSGAKTTGFEIPATRSINEIEVTNVNGVTLAGGNLTVNGNCFLDGASGSHLTLGANNITITGSITGAFSGAHFITNGAGALKLIVGATPVEFPVGVSSASYDPVTITNAGTSDVYAVKVGNTVTSPSDPTLVVNRQWDISEAVAGGSNCTLALTYDATATTGANYSSANPMVVGHYAGGWTETSATIAGTTVSASGFTSFSPYAVANATGLLPLELLSFKGAQNAASNLLSWTTAMEINVGAIEVQRKLAGESDFKPVGTVAPKGTHGNSTSSYSFEDHIYAQDAYYRLNIIDLDGKSTYSGIIRLSRNTINADLKIYPNPVTSSAVLSLNTPEDADFDVQIVNQSGQQVSALTHAFVQNGETYLLPMQVSDLPTGIYYVIVKKDGSEASTLKLVKQ